MAKNHTLIIRSNNDELPWLSGARAGAVNRLINFLSSAAGGARSGAVTLEARTTAVAATGTVGFDTSGGGNSGTKTATINGVANSVTWTTSDSNTAALLAAAINASGNALVNKHVTASASQCVVTISSGSGAIAATVNGITFTVTWATSDTHTGDLLAAAINLSTNAAIYGLITASNNAGVVTITDSSGAAMTATVTGTGATVAVNTLIKAIHPGYSGNAVTLAATGTGGTASGARLTGGTSDAVDSVTF